MDLKRAHELSQEIVDILKLYCKPGYIKVVGSILREKQFPGDIDIVLIPGNQGALAIALQNLGPKIRAGPRMHSCRYKGEQVDIYIADKRTWPTLVLIRTGSKAHNKMLRARALAMGGKLHADGSGLELCGERCYPDSEAGIFTLLGLPYVEPKNR